MAAALRPASVLPQAFWRKTNPVEVSGPQLVLHNDALAAQLGLSEDFFQKPETWLALSGNGPWQDFESVALAYSGHQFGHWNPLMGDGRAHLIATLGNGFEVQLKGSGSTPFSRNGDGRAALGPMLREYIVSEAMVGLSIPTTRSLAVVATGEQVYRKRREPGAIVTRIAKSHVRVGSFQFAAAHLGKDGVAALYAHEQQRSHPHTDNVPGFLASVITRQAQLIAKWMCVGFIHGVMNTDNMAISGETIDYGPCAFMDRFYPQKVFSSIDQFGRYAWDKQPAIGLWNLTRFAEALLQLLDDDTDQAVVLAKQALEKFYPQFEDAFETGMLQKFGITERRVDDGEFIAEILKVLMEEKQDFTLFFRELSRGVEISPGASALWRKRLQGVAPAVPLMQSVNPIYIARNHQVAMALSEAEDGNMMRIHQLLKLLKTPYTEQANMTQFEAAPLPDEEVQQTFCGT
jgi:serine/tyrosine/threonine adenylyltransferase